MKFKKKDLPPSDGEWVYERHMKCWRSELNGRLHNSLGPAYVSDFGIKIWFIDGLHHRLDGPAVERLDRPEEHRYVNGKHVFKQDFPLAIISFLLGVDAETAKLIEQEIEQ